MKEKNGKKSKKLIYYIIAKELTSKHFFFFCLNFNKITYSTERQNENKEQ